MLKIFKISILRLFLSVPLCVGFCMPVLAKYKMDNAPWNDHEIISIVGASILGLFDAKERGPYNELFDLVTADNAVPIELKMLPIRRAQRAFLDKTVIVYLLAQ